MLNNIYIINNNCCCLFETFKTKLLILGSIVGVYPGTVYQPYQPILIQSVRNQFLFRCADGVLVDGNDRGISRVIFKSCSSRDQVVC